MSKKKDKSSPTSVLMGTGLALLGTTCCALPALLVALGLGGAMASLVSTVPWLIGLSKYKAWTFALTGLVLSYAWWRTRQVALCDIADSKRLRLQKILLTFATTMFVISVIAAYLLLPFMEWWDSI